MYLTAVVHSFWRVRTCECMDVRWKPKSKSQVRHVLREICRRENYTFQHRLPVQPVVVSECDENWMDEVISKPTTAHPPNIRTFYGILKEDVRFGV